MSCGLMPARFNSLRAYRRFAALAIWSFSNDDGDGNENAETAIGLLGKTTSLNVDHNFLYVYLPLAHDYDMKMPSKFTFYGGRKPAKTKVFFSF